MPYQPNMAASARRHLQSAEMLKGTHREDVAAYLYGIAAECAMKAMMVDQGMRRSAIRREDPFFAHFPELRSMLRDSLHGRTATVLARFIMDDSFMNNWDTNMRYCAGGEIKRKWIQAWSEQAKDIVGALGT